MNRFLTFIMLVGLLYACKQSQRFNPQISGGGCSYEKTNDTFTIDSFVNDTAAYYLLSTAKNKHIRELNLITIFLELPNDTALFSSPQTYLKRRIVINEQHILTGACNPYVLNSIEILK